MDEPRRIESTESRPPVRGISVDLCVVGGGAAGVSAAVEGARMGLRVALLDGLPQIGGQSVNGLIGTLCGFFSSGPDPFQVTYGLASDVLADLKAADAISFRRGRGTVIGMYDEAELAASYARHLRRAGVTTVLGALLCEAEREGSRITRVTAQTRYGAIQVEAATFIDATGDAMLAALAGATLQQADVPVYGTSMFSIGDLGAQAPERNDIIDRLESEGGRYGLQRRDGFVFAFPQRGVCIVNLTHFRTPLDPVAMSDLALAARDGIDSVMGFLRGEFPQAFSAARVQSVGQPGVRQTRGVAAIRTLTTNEVRQGVRHADAIGRCAWPIEFHGAAEGVHWEELPAGQDTWIPLSCLLSRDITNLAAAGRCVDAEPFALGAIRVIGPCMAMGAAAAAAARVGGGNLHELDVAAVQALVNDNITRKDAAPAF